MSCCRDHDYDCDVFDAFRKFREESPPSIAADAAGGRPSEDSPGCTFCESEDDIHLLDGNNVCLKCGTINTRFIDMSPEWRYYGFDDSRSCDPSRCGMPINDLLPNSSFGNIIGYTHNESHQTRMMRRYHMWNAMTYRERSLFNIFDTLSARSAGSGIPKSIVEQAKAYYKQLSEMQISRGENRLGLIASSVYMACKAAKVARSAKEIATMFNIKQSTMTRGCKRFQELLKMDVDETRAEDFIGRFCCTLSMPRPYLETCRRVIAVVVDTGILSHSTPQSVAAGCIFFCSAANKWPYTKADVCSACDVSSVTVTKCAKQLAGFEDVFFGPGGSQASK